MSTIRTLEIKPDMSDNFRKAEFYFRPAMHNEFPRYLLILMPGIDCHGREMLDRDSWTSFANDTGAATIAATFKKKDSSKFDKHSTYSAAQYGSGAALEKAIRMCCDGIPGCRPDELPLLIYGESGGGQFAYGFSCYRPKRMIGFAAIKGGYYYPEPTDGTQEVPGMLVSGERDLERRRRAIHDVFNLHRTLQAPVCWLEDCGEHGAGESLALVQDYFRALITRRLSDSLPGVQAICASEGVTMDIATKTILHAGLPKPGEGTSAGWLPTGDLLKKWVETDVGASRLAKVN